jgi:hypothetical protein
MTGYEAFRPDPVVCAVAHFHFDIEITERDFDEPHGLIIGEQPGPNTNRALPMWPFPRTSAGGRLMAMSGIEPAEYLRRLARVNLVEAYAAKWDGDKAVRRAGWLLASLPPYARVVLLGERVRYAIEGAAAGAEIPAHFVQLPHPSGRNSAYNDPGERERARRAVQWAAGLRDSP